MLHNVMLMAPLGAWATCGVSPQPCSRAKYLSLTGTLTGKEGELQFFVRIRVQSSFLSLLLSCDLPKYGRLEIY